MWWKTTSWQLTCISEIGSILSATRFHGNILRATHQSSGTILHFKSPMQWSYSLLMKCRYPIQSINRWTAWTSLVRWNYQFSGFLLFLAVAIDTLSQCPFTSMQITFRQHQQYAHQMFNVHATHIRPLLLLQKLRFRWVDIFIRRRSWMAKIAFIRVCSVNKECH